MSVQVNWPTELEPAHVYRSPARSGLPKWNHRASSDAAAGQTIAPTKLALGPLMGIGPIRPTNEEDQAL